MVGHTSQTSDVQHFGFLEIRPQIFPEVWGAISPPRAAGFVATTLGPNEEPLIRLKQVALLKAKVAACKNGQPKPGDPGVARN